MMTGIIMASTVTEDGKKVCYLPKNVTDIELSDEPVYLDIPAPEADKLTLLEYIDVYDDNYEYIYTGDGATLANYTAYCQKPDIG